MKKIIILALVVCLAFSCMVVGASAEEYMPLRGVWRFNDIIDPYAHSFSHFDEGSITFRDEDGAEWYGLGYNPIENIFIFYYNGTAHTAYDFDENEWLSGRQTITIVEGTVSQAFIELLNEIAVEQTCDGSTCPVGDVNADGYCDECGAKMRTMGEASQIAPYPSYLPEKSFTSNHHDVVAKINGEIYYIVALSEDCLFYGNDGNNLYHDSHQYIYYKLVDGAWDYDKATISTALVCHQTDIIWTNRNIYFENGDPFFPVPLWAMVEKITQGGMESEIPKIHSSMASLAVCGIGLLVLLIGLILLPKVLYKFL